MCVCVCVPFPRYQVLVIVTLFNTKFNIPGHLIRNLIYPGPINQRVNAAINATFRCRCAENNANAFV